ncbi:GTP pyrophosphokinase [Deinococcus humi]|uniref:PpGpp synthetase/RelA/SpoT-type nucleotidyltransferase n=1 Tax=Deinococcus humi TaxID=662880 RepID=A0A7W8JSV3_9DEIO|nr:GTP pyrophosphokinase family protein [Deinococcus humi]MBB5362320.1 ppGpp synthetase/RelA/SpoT-type nucleotidyltransferase [Deinococcus humi]GGO29351.1 GTP pyrophosphokinase [Deinococcus humi]
MTDPLVTTYQAREARYAALRDAALAHTTHLIEEAGLKVHNITGRLKRPESLADKLRRKPGRYRTLEDVTDLVAVRVITYFESDVAAVSRLLEAHHEINWEHSVDKSMMHDPDRFGYMGVHYVVKVPRLVEQFTPHVTEPPQHYEVQIRSILQHAWAEIEHDLGYKNREAVPREVQRRFYRLAGLLEMADEEFMALDRLSRDYAATLPERVRTEPDSVFIDAQSIQHLLEVSPVRDLDEAVAARLGVPLLTRWPDPERPQRLSTLLHYVSVHSVGGLLGELRRNRPDILDFAARLLPRLPEAWLPAGGVRPGTGLVNHALLRACANPSLNPQEIITALDMSGILSTRQMVDTVLDTYAEVTNENGIDPRHS